MAADITGIARFDLELTGVEATEALGAALGELAEAGDVLALHGELGAGKTALVRGLARGLGLEEGVASPTYILMDAHQGGRLPLFHFDAWMEGREKALFLDGGDEWLRAGGVAVVEWAGRVGAWLPTPRLEVELRHVSLAARHATLRVVTAETLVVPAVPADTHPGAAAATHEAGREAAAATALRRRLAALAARLAGDPGVRSTPPDESEACPGVSGGDRRTSPEGEAPEIGRTC